MNENISAREQINIHSYLLSKICRLQIKSSHINVHTYLASHVKIIAGRTLWPILQVRHGEWCHSSTPKWSSGIYRWYFSSRCKHIYKHTQLILALVKLQHFDRQGIALTYICITSDVITSFPRKCGSVGRDFRNISRLVVYPRTPMGEENSETAK